VALKSRLRASRPRAIGRPKGWPSKSRGTRLSGILSIASKPKSSSTWVAVDRPAPEGPVISTKRCSVCASIGSGAEGSQIIVTSIQPFTLKIEHQGGRKMVILHPPHKGQRKSHDRDLSARGKSVGFRVF